MHISFDTVKTVFPYDPTPEDLKHLVTINKFERDWKREAKLARAYRNGRK